MREPKYGYMIYMARYRQMRYIGSIPIYNKVQQSKIKDKKYVGWFVKDILLNSKRYIISLDNYIFDRSGGEIIYREITERFFKYEVLEENIPKNILNNKVRDYIIKYNSDVYGYNDFIERDGNEKGDYVVYKHTSPSGKSYIGITQQKPENRWKNGYGYIKQEKFYNAIKKYGWDSFSHEILKEGLSLIDAWRYEMYYIELYDSYVNGYNLTIGGPNIIK